MPKPSESTSDFKDRIKRIMGPRPEEEKTLVRRPTDRGYYPPPRVLPEVKKEAQQDSDTVYRPEKGIWVYKGTDTNALLYHRDGSPKFKNPTTVMQRGDAYGEPRNEPQHGSSPKKPRPLYSQKDPKITEETGQSKVDGAPTKKTEYKLQTFAEADTETGSMHSPSYWAMRIVQGLKEYSGGDAESMYDNVISEAKKNGLTDAQENAVDALLLKWNVPVPVKNPPKDVKPYQPVKGDTTIDFKQKQVQAKRSSQFDDLPPISESKTYILQRKNGSGFASQTGTGDRFLTNDTPDRKSARVFTGAWLAVTHPRWSQDYTPIEHGTEQRQSQLNSANDPNNGFAQMYSRYRCPDCGYQSSGHDKRTCPECGYNGDWIQPGKTSTYAHGDLPSFFPKKQRQFGHEQDFRASAVRKALRKRKGQAAAPQVTNKPVCPNCGQWQDETRNGHADCFNECAARGFAPKQPSQKEQMDYRSKWYPEEAETGPNVARDASFPHKSIATSLQNRNQLREACDRFLEAYKAYTSDEKAIRHSFLKSSLEKKLASHLKNNFSRDEIAKELPKWNFPEPMIKEALENLLPKKVALAGPRIALSNDRSKSRIQRQAEAVEVMAKHSKVDALTKEQQLRISVLKEKYRFATPAFIVRKATTGPIDDHERRLWILNDEGLYDMYRQSGLSEQDFIAQNQTFIDEAINNVTSGSKPAHYLKYGPRSAQYTEQPEDKTKPHPAGAGKGPVPPKTEKWLNKEDKDQETGAVKKATIRLFARLDDGRVLEATIDEKGEAQSKASLDYELKKAIRKNDSYEAGWVAYLNSRLS